MKSPARWPRRLDEGFKNQRDDHFGDVRGWLVIGRGTKENRRARLQRRVAAEILGDKRSRGAFGEVQLEAL